MHARNLSSGLLAALLFTACRGEPAPSLAPRVSTGAPAGASLPSAAPPAAPPVAAASIVATAPSVAPPTLPAPSAAPADVVDADPAAEPPLLGGDGAPLPQTEERPSATTERFQRRMQLLADSIRTGDAERAKSTFFPLVAYAQVKDVQKPERDYRYRLLAHFERDVREYHQALGPDAEKAELIGVEVPEARAQWMKPGKEGNRIGYFRVLRSQLRFRLASGKERRLELTSMISWRGEWYVVHLHGFD